MVLIQYRIFVSELRPAVSSGTQIDTITFVDNYSFEESEDGLLVIRYDYSVAGNASITERRTFLNNHYVLMRLFDHLNENGDGPAENVYNASGEVTQMNSHISPWSKLSWYQCCTL